MSDQQGTDLNPPSTVITVPWNIKKTGGLTVIRKKQKIKVETWKVQSLTKSSVSGENVCNSNPADWTSGLLDLFQWYFCGYFSGFYCPLGSAYPLPCEAGSYCNQTGLDAPAGPCAAGYHCPKGSLNPYATPCPTGHYCPPGTRLPLPCPVGTIKSETLLLCNIQLGPYIFGHWHNFHHFGSVHHHNGLEMKQSWCALSADFQL